MTFEIRLMRKHDLTNIYFSLFVDNFLTILTIQRQSWRLATLETLITILTIENLNSDHLWDLAIKSDAGQHLQFLRCFWRLPKAQVDHQLLHCLHRCTNEQQEGACFGSTEFIGQKKFLVTKDLAFGLKD